MTAPGSHGRRTQTLLRGAIGVVFVVGVGVVIAGLGVSGCATGDPDWLRAGPAWRQVTSAHFVVRTDLDPAQADQIARLFEETRAAILTAAWAGFPAPRDRISVVAFRSDEELASFLGPRFIGAHGADFRAALFPSTIVLAPTGAHGDQATRGALARHLGRVLLPVQPAWHLEGLSHLLETSLRYDPSAQQVHLDGVPPDFETLAQQLPLATAAQLFQPFPDDRAGRARMVPASGLLVHYLLTRRRQAYDQFRSRLAAPEPRAWATVFADWNVDRIDADLSDHLRGGRFPAAVWPVTSPTSRDNLDLRPMSAADLHVMRAHLLAAAATPTELKTLAPFHTEIDEALSEEPPPLDALVLKYYADDYVPGAIASPAGRPLAQRATDAYPGSWMAWLMMADSEGYLTVAGAEALARAAALAPNEPQILSRLAYRKGVQGHWDDALVISTAALRDRAVNSDLLVLHVRALTRVGQCDEAAAWAAALSIHYSAATARAVSDEWRNLAPSCLDAGKVVGGAPPRSPTTTTTTTTATAPASAPSRPPVGRQMRACPPDGDERATTALTPAQEQALMARLRSSWHAEQAWQILDARGPRADRREYLTVVQISLTPDGRLEDLCLAASSGIDRVDLVGWNAVLDATPLRLALPGPADANRPLRFQFGFQYRAADRR